MQLPAPGIVSRYVEKPDDIWISSKTKKIRYFKKSVSWMMKEMLKHLGGHDILEAPSVFVSPASHTNRVNLNLIFNFKF